MTPDLIRTREYERVDLTGVPRRAQVRDALLAATASLREPVFRVDRKGQLWATGYVGMVQAQGITVEVLPRVSETDDEGSESNFLLHLLTAARLVPHRMWTPGRVALGNVPLFEIVMRAAAEHLQAVLGEHGPPRRFHEIEEYAGSILGTVDMTRVMRQLPSERNLVPIRHAPLQADNPLARLIRALASYLRRVTASRRTRALLTDALGQLDAAAEVTLDLHLTEAAQPIPGQEEHWTALHEFAASLCRGLRPDPTKSGMMTSRLLLFSLDDIFERVLRRALPRALDPSDLHLAPRTPSRHFLRDLGNGVPQLRLRPDYLILNGDGPVVVADAKWKQLATTERSVGLARDDVFQLSAYLNRYRLPAGILFFPADAERRRAEGPAWSRELAIEGSESVIRAVAIDVFGLVSPTVADRKRALQQLRHAVIEAARHAPAGTQPEAA